MIPFTILVKGIKYPGINLEQRMRKTYEMKILKLF